MDLNQFARVRPFLFHLTSRNNIRRIKTASSLDPAATLLSHAGRADLLNARRRGHRQIQLDGELVVLRDQDPLHERAIAFEPGWDLRRFVGHVNQHVFFWPGTLDGPIPAGRNHFERYASDQPLVLRIGLYQLLVANGQAEPRFCRFNSGAPRVTGGRRSPRGATTYMCAEEFNGTSSDVTEVVFAHRMVLPPSTQIGHSYGGPWCTLAAASI